MSQLPRYTLRSKLAGGNVYYRYNPPKKYVDAGIVARCNLGNVRDRAIRKAEKFNVLIDEYDAEQATIVNAEKNKTVYGLVHDYYSSHDYNKLREETKEHYKGLLQAAMDTEIEGKVLKDIYYKEMTTRKAKLAYELWCKRGISMANHIMATMRVVFYHGMNMEHCTTNPFANIKKHKTSSRKVVWTQDDIRQFLDIAYSEWKWRNIGLIAQMAYEWCQRVGDIRVLKWENLNLDDARVHIKQSKRRAEVFLPISDDLCEMLQEQREAFGFQEYVVPNPKPVRGVYKPYTMYKLPNYARVIMNEANLSTELRLSDLRRTGTTEMVDAGVGIGQIMSVTGHANPQSVKPYIKHTYQSANYALTERKKVLTT